jgi:exosortase A-associated hydrolase 1/exosortase A-associated hydrolase 2
MVAMQARAFAAMGMGTLLLDMHGTGDSPGEFEQGDWDIWLNDLKCGIAWLRQNANGCRTVWGIRLGAIMAAQLAAHDESLDRLLLWQPVVAGKSYWTQFLRIRIAAEMGQADGIRSTEVLRAMAAQGQTVEASGYRVCARLATALDALRLPDDGSLSDKEIHWFEVLAGADGVVSRANAKCAEAMTATGSRVNLVQLAGPSFWQLHERSVVPELITATTQAAQEWAPLADVHAGASRSEVCSPATVERDEVPVVFPCEANHLTGIVHRAASDAHVGIVIVVAGGPQYRAGAHRQFVSLARMFTASGYPVLRFDLRGMGDSSGVYQGYHHSRPDIRAAVDQLQRSIPSVREVVLFGECESASGILFYAHEDPRVRKIALANPWVRTQEGQAEVILKHYYRDRLLSREFWRGLFHGELKVARALDSFIEVVTIYLKGRRNLRAASSEAARSDLDGLPLPAKTAEGLRRFGGSVLLLMSGHDYIAREFDEVTKSSKAWEGLLTDKRVQRKDIANADHTFSRPEWKAEAQHALRVWLAAP